MQVFLTGGRGEIGGPTLKALIRAGHNVTALARSDAAAADMAQHGAQIVRGNLTSPADWIAEALAVDAVVHTAATFDDDEEDVDRRFLDELILGAQDREHPLRVLYTGGCWLYGETGDVVAEDGSPFAPPDGFLWAVEHSARLHASAGIEAITLHPAMVYGDGGGVFDRFLAEAREGGRIELWESGAIRWPVVHRDDVGDAYRLALERGMPGTHYNLSAEAGVATGCIADAVASRCGITHEHKIMRREQALAAHGLWAEGPMIDQQMSGKKATKDLSWEPRWRDVCAFIEHDLKFTR